MNFVNSNFSTKQYGFITTVLQLQKNYRLLETIVRLWGQVNVVYTDLAKTFSEVFYMLMTQKTV